MGKHKITIFCKSYAPDLRRVIKLAQSIEKFNCDNIPFYLSCPYMDLTLFKKELKGFSCIRIVPDEDILEKTDQAARLNQTRLDPLPGNLMQQVIKSEFWRLGLSDNYLVIDSDSYFIRSFYIKDFMADENNPYTVFHECKDLLSFAARIGKSRIHKDYCDIREKFQTIFNRGGKYFDFGPTPVIWSSKVWEDLYNNYAVPNHTNMNNMINVFQSELLWYGEALLHSQLIPIIPLEPLFKVYHYKEQFKEGKRLGEKDTVLAKNYFGVVMQSNWSKPLNFTQNKSGNIFKSLAGRYLKR